MPRTGHLCSLSEVQDSTPLVSTAILSFYLCGSVAGQDIRVTCSGISYCEDLIDVLKCRLTSIENGHGGAAEELTAGGTKLNL